MIRETAIVLMGLIIFIIIFSTVSNNRMKNEKTIQKDEESNNKSEKIEIEEAL